MFFFSLVLYGAILGGFHGGGRWDGDPWGPDTGPRGGSGVRGDLGRDPGVPVGSVGTSAGPHGTLHSGFVRHVGCADRRFRRGVSKMKRNVGF